MTKFQRYLEKYTQKHNKSNLSLARVKITKDDIEEFVLMANNSTFQELEQLDLSRTGIKDFFGLFDKLEIGVFPKLKSIDLHESGLTDEGLFEIVSLAKKGIIPKLNQLLLPTNEITSAGVKSLINAIGSGDFRDIQRINLYHNKIEHFGNSFRDLPEGSLDNLTSFILQHNHIGSEGVQELVDAAGRRIFANLQFLDLSFNSIKKDDVRALLNGFTNQVFNKGNSHKVVLNDNPGVAGVDRIEHKGITEDEVADILAASKIPQMDDNESKDGNVQEDIISNRLSHPKDNDDETKSSSDEKEWVRLSSRVDSLEAQLGTGHSSDIPKEIQNDHFRHAFYHELQWMLNAVYTASSSIAVDMVEGKSPLPENTISNVLKTVSNHLPAFGFGTSVIAEILDRVGHARWRDKVRKYSKIADSPVEMSTIARELAKELSFKFVFDKFIEYNRTSKSLFSFSTEYEHDIENNVFMVISHLKGKKRHNKIIVDNAMHAKKERDENISKTASSKVEKERADAGRKLATLISKQLIQEVYDGELEITGPTPDKVQSMVKRSMELYRERIVELLTIEDVALVKNIIGKKDWNIIKSKSENSEWDEVKIYFREEYLSNSLKKQKKHVDDKAIDLMRFGIFKQMCESSKGDASNVCIKNFCIKYPLLAQKISKQNNVLGISDVQYGGLNEWSAVNQDSLVSGVDRCNSIISSYLSGDVFKTHLSEKIKLRVELEQWYPGTNGGIARYFTEKMIVKVLHDNKEPINDYNIRNFRMALFKLISKSGFCLDKFGKEYPQLYQRIKPVDSKAFVEKEKQQSFDAENAFEFISGDGGSPASEKPLDGDLVIKALGESIN